MCFRKLTPSATRRSFRRVIPAYKSATLMLSARSGGFKSGITHPGVRQSTFKRRRKYCWLCSLAARKAASVLLHMRRPVPLRVRRPEGAANGDVEMCCSIGCLRCNFGQLRKWVDTHSKHQSKRHQHTGGAHQKATIQHAGVPVNGDLGIASTRTRRYVKAPSASSPSGKYGCTVSRRGAQGVCLNRAPQDYFFW